jgi:26S proteasome regulatory subunit N8
MSSSDNSKIHSIHPISSGPIVDVTVHPLVLLSVADHYHRVARGTRKRVVGVLLGEVVRGRVDVTNSFAVPFEEDAKVPVGLFSCVTVSS